LVSYSTGPGKLALDGDGQNSLFSLELASALQDRGLKLEDAFKRISERVYATTDRQQLPWYTSSVHGEYFLASGALTQETQIAQAQVQRQPSPPRRALFEEKPSGQNSQIESELEGRIAFFID
jgi:uncharacterized caspase-like protein